MLTFVWYYTSEFSSQLMVHFCSTSLAAEENKAVLPWPTWPWMRPIGLTLRRRKVSTPSLGSSSWTNWTQLNIDQAIPLSPTVGFLSKMKRSWTLILFNIFQPRHNLGLGKNYRSMNITEDGRDTCQLCHLWVMGWPPTYARCRSWQASGCIRIIQASRPLVWAPWETWPRRRTIAWPLGDDPTSDGRAILCFPNLSETWRSQ